MLNIKAVEPIQQEINVGPQSHINAYQIEWKINLLTIEIINTGIEINETDLVSDMLEGTVNFP